MSHRKKVSSAGITLTSLSRLHLLSTALREKKKIEAEVRTSDRACRHSSLCGHVCFEMGHTQFPRLALNFAVAEMTGAHHQA